MTKAANTVLLIGYRAKSEDFAAKSSEVDKKQKQNNIVTEPISC